MQHPGLHCEETTLRRCYCNHWVEVTHHRGVEANNRDEYYSGECDQCGEWVQWEPNYDDDYEATRRHQRGNVLLVGQALDCVRKRRVNHAPLTEEQIASCKVWLDNCETHQLSLAPRHGKFVRPEELPFMSGRRVSQLRKLLDWVCTQIAFG